MKLNVKERIVLLSILPKEGDFKTLKQLRKFREELAFNDHENKALNFRVENGNYFWTEPGDEPMVKVIEIGETMMEIIVESLKRLNDQKKLNNDTFTLYERFVENGGKDDE